MTKHWTLPVIAMLCAIALYAGYGARLASAAAGDIYNLGTLGGTSSAGYDVNDAGQVAGSAKDAVGRSRAFLWESRRGMTDLGTANGYTEARAYAISTFGSVVGVEYDLTTVVSRALAWTPNEPNGTTGTLTDLARGDYSTTAADINAAGQVVGSSTYTYFVPDETCSPDNPYYPNCGGPGGAWVTVRSAVLWENGVGADLTNSSAPEAANAINNAGQVAGNTATHAFRYDGAPGSGGIMYDLGTLGGTLSVGNAINDAGQVVGSSQTTGDTGNHAFRYTGTPGAGGVMVDLSTLGGVLYSDAYDINDAGFVVGFADRAAGAGGGSWATLWQNDPGNTAVDLDAWLDAINPALGAHWNLKEARGINIDGLITGQGIYDDGPGGLSDGYRAFVLDASSLVSVLAGDFNGNGTVDAADYVVWRKGLGTIYTQSDYNLWRAHFGQTAGSGAAVPSAESLSAAVPEPSAVALLMLTAAVPFLIARRGSKAA